MSTDTTTPLQDARDRIDEIDRRFVELLAERYDVVDDICEMKEETGETVKDHDREAQLLDHVSTIAEENGLSPELVRRLYGEILDHSVARQRERRNEDAPDTGAASTHNGTAHNGTDASSAAQNGRSTNGRATPPPASTEPSNAVASANAGASVFMTALTVGLAEMDVNSSSTLHKMITMTEGRCPSARSVPVSPAEGPPQGRTAHRKTHALKHRIHKSRQFCDLRRAHTDRGLVGARN